MVMRIMEQLSDDDDNDKVVSILYCIVEQSEEECKRIYCFCKGKAVIIKGLGA